MQEIMDNMGPGRAGVVYAMTNAAAGNEVVAFRRGTDGTLARIGAYPTGGNGTSPASPNGIDPLSSQGSLSFSRDRRFLFAVNAGSNSISSFRAAADGRLVLAGLIRASLGVW